MKHLQKNSYIKSLLGVTSLALMIATVANARVTPSARTFTAGQEVRLKGVILSRDGDTIKLRADDDSVGTVDLTDTTKIQMKHGMFGMSKTKMDNASLVPGLHVDVNGEGNDKGDLVAKKVIFDPNSMRASRQIDARVSPLESRAGALENREGKLEGRADNLESQTGQLQTKTGQLASQQQQTDQQVGQVKQQAAQANEGVTDVNKRVTNLDEYQSKFSATVYFKVNSATLTPDAQKDLDELVQKATAEKGYMIEVAGFADKTGTQQHNQVLSDQRAESVVRYLEEQGNVPLRRILTPAGLGISHEVADNSTRAGRKMNRRVEVNVLVNSGITAGSNAPMSPQSSASNKSNTN
jgi:outer membrane protein OmpA-like peptidoglycan-associated protein